MEIPPNPIENCHPIIGAAHSTQIELLPATKKKRAPRSSELDDPLIRNEIEFLFTTNCWALGAIVEHINKTYGLNLKQHQYRDRLVKWGCKKRLTHQEYQKVYQAVAARSALGKRSRIFLDETTEVPEKRFKRWESRNVTFTDRLFSKGNLGVSAGHCPSGRTIESCRTPADNTASRVFDKTKSYGLVRTPSPNPEAYILPIVKKSVILYSPRTPIGQLGQSLEQFLPQNLRGSTNNELAVGIRVPDHLPVIGVIIYLLSNKILGHFDGTQIHLLLDKVDKHGFRNHLQKLLSNNSPSILATCSVLITYFYLRKDDEMLNFVYDHHPQLKKSLYDHLHVFLHRQPVVDREKALKDIISDIVNAQLFPESVREAQDLLFACKMNLKYLTSFCRLWHPQKASLLEAGSYVGRLEDIPLYSPTVAGLKLLLGCGFRRYKYTLLFEAIVLDKKDATGVLCQNLGIQFGRSEITSSNRDAKLKPTWELLERVTFYDIAAKCTTEIISPHAFEWLESKDPVDLVLVQAACAQPFLTEYLVEILQWKYSIPAERAACMAIDALPRGPGYRKIYDDEFGGIFSLDIFSSEDDQRALVLDLLLNFGVDPNRTNFWQTSVWKEIISVDLTDWSPNSSLEAILGVLLDCGTDTNGCVKIDLLNEISCSIDSAYYECFYEPYFYFEEINTPIEIAFTLKYSWIFCFLLEESVITDSFCYRLSSGAYTRSDVHAGFVQAIKDRDRETIEELWACRISGNWEVNSALESGDIAAAKEILLRNDRNSLAILLAFQLCLFYDERYVSFSNVYEILEFILQMGVHTNLSPAFWNDRRKNLFRYCLSRAIFKDNPEFLKLLMKFYPADTRAARSQNTVSVRYHQFQEDDIFLLDKAAQYSLACLKFLISQGFHINEGNSGNYNETALRGAIQSGNLETVAYILSEGGNIYAPCGHETSAIAFAIKEGRLDSLAMMLDAVPNSYPLASAAIEDPAITNEYIVEYVRGWKHRETCVNMEEESLISDGSSISSVIPSAPPQFLLQSTGAFENFYAVLIDDGSLLFTELASSSLATTFKLTANDQLLTIADPEEAIFFQANLTDLASVSSTSAFHLERKTVLGGEHIARQTISATALGDLIHQVPGLVPPTGITAAFYFSSGELQLNFSGFTYVLYKQLQTPPLPLSPPPLLYWIPYDIITKNEYQSFCSDLLGNTANVTETSTAIVSSATSTYTSVINGVTYISTSTTYTGTITTTEYSYSQYVAINAMMQARNARRAIITPASLVSFDDARVRAGCSNAAAVPSTYTTTAFTTTSYLYISAIPSTSNPALVVSTPSITVISTSIWLTSTIAAVGFLRATVPTLTSFQPYLYLTIVPGIETPSSYPEVLTAPPSSTGKSWTSGFAISTAPDGSQSRGVILWQEVLANAPDLGLFGFPLTTATSTFALATNKPDLLPPNMAFSPDLFRVAVADINVLAFLPQSPLFVTWNGTDNAFYIDPANSPGNMSTFWYFEDSN
ncbi:hypothetical protein TWF694_006001 [Orbilia ellipsospora]|uniref:Clr5 domain-containing protein n=1 Tax=Orbilia ellipsospora TaxID=2528407 RepID=A0AAV9WR50_9PEZI